MSFLGLITNILLKWSLLFWLMNTSSLAANQNILLFMRNICLIFNEFDLLNIFFLLINQKFILKFQILVLNQQLGIITTKVIYFSFIIFYIFALEIHSLIQNPFK